MNVLQTSWNIQCSYASECEDLWNVTPCNLAGRYEHFTGFSCLHLQDRKVQSSPFICWFIFFRVLVPIFPLSTTVIYFFFTLGLLFYPEDGSNFLPDYIPEDSNRHTCHDNLKPHLQQSVYVLMWLYISTCDATELQNVKLYAMVCPAFNLWMFCPLNLNILSITHTSQKPPHKPWRQDPAT
jgi:hypothetical protein